MAACVNELDRFEQLRSEMRQDTIPPNAANLVITTHACENSEMFEEAFLLQKDLLQRKQQRFWQMPHTLHSSCSCLTSRFALEL